MRSFVPFSSLLVVLVAWMQPTWAQFTGLSAELDTMLWATESPDDPLADLAYYGVYDVYANFTDSSDVLSADTPMLVHWGRRRWASMHLAGATTRDLHHGGRQQQPTMRLSLHGPTTRSGPLAWRPRRTMDNCLAASTCHPPRNCVPDWALTMAHSTSRDPRTTGLQMLWLVKT